MEVSLTLVQKEFIVQFLNNLIGPESDYGYKDLNVQLHIDFQELLLSCYSMEEENRPDLCFNFNQYCVLL